MPNDFFIKLPKFDKVNFISGPLDYSGAFFKFLGIIESFIY